MIKRRDFICGWPHVGESAFGETSRTDPRHFNWNGAALPDAAARAVMLATSMEACYARFEPLN
jgi:hypothetical protein